jgi:hypothetical protein
MKVFWATAAQRDRADIIDYISQDSPLAAIRMDELAFYFRMLTSAYDQESQLARSPSSCLRHDFST